jgi:hypothetical protein
MQKAIKTTLSVLLLALPVVGQSLTIPHIVDGAGWQSTIVLTNMSANAASATLVFHKETGGGNTGPWTPTFQEVVSTSGLTMAGGSTLFLHTTGKASDPLSQGWAELNADAGVTGYVVFTIRVPGRQDQEGTAPAATASNRILVPYDDSNGFVTGIAVTNPTGSAQTLSVGFRTTSGGVAVNTLPAIPAGGHMSFVLSQQFPVINGHEGLAEFYSSSGNVSMIALRFNPTSSFTAAPVYAQTGAPLITASSDPYDPTMPDPNPNPYPYPYPYQTMMRAGSVH